MTGFTAYDSEFRAIMNYPNVRGLFGISPVKPRQTERQVRPSESFEFRTELEKWTQELREPQSNDSKPVELSKGSKRVRVASPEFENESPIASPTKKQKTEVDGDDAMIVEQDGYSIWDAMLWGSPCSGIAESLLASPQKAAPQKTAQVLSGPAESVFDGEFPALQQSIPESWNFTIWEDADAGTDDYSMVGRTAHWVPEFDDENKENEPPEFDVGMEESVSESQEYYFPERPQYRRVILGELQQN